MKFNLIINLLKYVYYNIGIKENVLMDVPSQSKYLFKLTVNKYYFLNVLSYLYLDINNTYKLLTDITAVDFLSKKLRFNVVYNLLSIMYHSRILINIFLRELDKLKSIVNIYPCANWYEREIWDLYGIIFMEHGDLRRILTDYGFVGFPLRKDYPLSGYNESYYDYLIESIGYRDIKLTQQFRVLK
jgi:NADH/F420H2 dehydrogenase subunit C